MPGWWSDVVEGFRTKLRELRELLDTPIAPAPELVPIPVRPDPRRRRR